MKIFKWFGLILSICSFLSCRVIAVSFQVHRIKNGWQSARVVAIYWPESALGYSIMLTFPKNEQNSDRAEITDILSDYGCDVYEGGGYPGAADYMTCSGVQSNSEADAKLKEILPRLDVVLREISRNEKIVKTSKELAEEKIRNAPVTEDKDGFLVKNGKREKCDPKGLWGEYSDGFREFTCTESGYFVEDIKAEHAAQEHEAHRAQLALELTTCVLSTKDLSDVLSYGNTIFAYPMVPYSQEDIDEKYRSALEIQKTLREMPGSPKCSNTQH
ncbi:MAG: hypothetical protein KGI50_07340 [Patescibacteria group bacterium]|nr:hypothetical protein [Patescibacteria group bacterium]MDE2438970.1 hypothetical protein [Patescibacteria group bacterium]